MKVVSILNHVLGPVMRGPSSSHTAGAWHLGRMARSLLGGRTPRQARLRFDPAGSYARTFEPQGAERAFALGLLGIELTDDRFFNALQEARAAGVDLRFEVTPLDAPDHPNCVDMEFEDAEGGTVALRGRSVGGGEVEITRLDGWPVLFNGAWFEVLVEVGQALLLEPVIGALTADGQVAGKPASLVEGGKAAVHVRRLAPLTETLRAELTRMEGVRRVWQCEPVYFVARGSALFESAADMVRLAEKERVSLSEIALAYEAQLLGLSREAVLEEMLRRYDLMARAAADGLAPNFSGMQLLAPSAGAVFRAEAEGRLSVRTPLTRAAARAMAVMHVNSAMGVVCAAPTGGSAGVLLGAMVTLAEERRLPRETIGRALLAAGAVGVIVARRATFAAEVAGCQVEIGAAGAMGAAAVADAVGGTPAHAAHAASISFQNTMGSVCDLVNGMVEIPCHTRNAVAAANAFLCADLILGGYPNPIPLDETIDAVYAVGRMMPAELRCTAKGGLAITPSALALKPRCCGSGCCG